MNNFCGRTRREFLWEAGAGFTGLALSALLARDGVANAQAPQSNANPLAPRPPHFAPKAKSVIFLFMDGGPSQIDTFDPKPRLQRDNDALRAEVGRVQGLLARARDDLQSFAEQQQEARALALTLREKHVAELVAQGRKNREIAIELGIGAHVVRNYLSSIYDKSVMSNRVELALWYEARRRQRGVI